MEDHRLHSKYRKGTSIWQAPVFQHLRALRKSSWKFITVYAIYFASLIFRESGLQDIFASG